MTQKEKLIELMLRASMDMFNIQTESIEIVADYLLDNGVVVGGYPCDLCAHNPPSSCDVKPCTICPARKMEGEK